MLRRLQYYSTVLLYSTHTITRLHYYTTIPTTLLHNYTTILRPPPRSQLAELMRHPLDFSFLLRSSPHRVHRAHAAFGACYTTILLYFLSVVSFILTVRPLGLAPPPQARSHAPSCCSCRVTRWPRRSCTSIRLKLAPITGTLQSNTCTSTSNMSTRYGHFFFKHGRSDHGQLVRSGVKRHCKCSDVVV